MSDTHVRRYGHAEIDSQPARQSKGQKKTTMSVHLSVCVAASDRSVGLRECLTRLSNNDESTKSNDVEDMTDAGN